MSEQQPELISSEPGSHAVGPDTPGSAPAQSAAMAQPPILALSEVASPGIADGDVAGTVGPDAPRAEAKPQALQPDALRAPAKVLNMSSGNRAWETDGVARKPDTGARPDGAGGRRLSALAAVAAVAAVAGALGSGLVIYGLPRLAGNETAIDQSRAVETSVARIDSSIQALKASVENSSRLSLAQLNKTSERLEKIEKAQADPTSKLGRLSEALELLRDAPPPIAAPSAEARIVSKDATGSIAPPSAAAPKAAVGRLPILEGWLLRRIAGGVALIEGRDGMFEVRPGDPVPGLGRVDAIRRQDGRWVVVTSRGLVAGH